MRLTGRRSDGIIKEEFDKCFVIPFDTNCGDTGKNQPQAVEFDVVIFDNNQAAETQTNEKAMPGTDFSSAIPIQIMLDNDMSFRMINVRHLFQDALIYFDTCVTYHFKVHGYFDKGVYDLWIAREDEPWIQMANKYAFSSQWVCGSDIHKLCIACDNSFSFKVENISFYEVKEEILSLHKEAAAPKVYHVGPSREYKTLQEVAIRLNPGDTVLVDGDCVYPGQVSLTRPGTDDARITIKGVRVNGKRPVIDGEGVSQDCVELSGHFYNFEGFEVRNAKRCGIHHHAHSIVIGDCVIHDCPGGILSYDVNTGSITIEHCEIYNCGNGAYEHQLYIATDELRFPGSVFRLEHCYLHHGKGGHNVKTRSERNEIYYNWIENAFYHNLELIGPDPDYNPVDEDMAREDSDVVGNVIISDRWYMVRVGGDGTGQSKGRCRFVNNTFVSMDEEVKEVFRIMFGIESIEMHNNVFYTSKASRMGILIEDKAEWSQGKKLIWGSNNWVQDQKDAPLEWAQTKSGSHPGFADVENFDFRLTDESPLIGAGRVPTESLTHYPFPNPLEVPLYFAPMRALNKTCCGTERKIEGQIIDIGACSRKG